MTADPRLAVDPDIRRACSPPGWFYTSESVFTRLRDHVFRRSWQLLTREPPPPGNAAPFTLLPGFLDEPLVLTSDAGRLRCLSNVCTHRGNLVVADAGPCRELRCRYHGRRFALDGRMTFMPEFEEAYDFPSARDDLPSLQLQTWEGLTFLSADPLMPFPDLVSPLGSRFRGLGLETLRFDPDTSRDYEVSSSWILYCENYLEGFHIPYVHGGLHKTLDYGAYRTETYPWASLQIGAAAPEEEPLELAAGHPDHGARVAGYYAWLFPNTMLNVYPWGLSVNLVEPLAVDRTRVRFLSFVGDAARREGGAGADLHGVELEDEAVVEAVQRGMRSRLYRGGRYSPSRETGVHHFHRLLAGFLG
jgi:choline monooxygenase